MAEAGFITSLWGTGGIAYARYSASYCGADATRGGTGAARCEDVGAGVQIFAPTDDTPAASVNGTVERYDTPVWQQIGVLLRDGIPLIVIAPIPEVVTLLAKHLQAE